jgi:hypothetical protein
VTTSAAAITGNAAGLAGFNDLGSGTLYGTRLVSTADNGTVIEIVLNSAALADLNAASGLFLFGGALGTVAGPSDQYVFGFSMASFVSDHTAAGPRCRTDIDGPRALDPRPVLRGSARVLARRRTARRGQGA